MALKVPKIPLNFYNTETRQKEAFVPLNHSTVSMYTCGPTVYDFPHIGNYRTYIFEDLLRRTLKFFDYDVTQVMNLTDVDDKTIRGANKNGVSLDDYTKPFKQAFFEDIETLNIERVEHYPPATEYIEEMIQAIQKLIEKGVAYRGKDGSVYYAIGRFPNYGRLSHLKLDELKAGASERVATDEYDKEHIADFVLWKAYDEERDGSIYWESPFGKGRPGWHLECSVMAMQLLGETIDIHVGGVDNIFPHHENEIAQSEACSGKCFVKYWLHSEHLIVENKKMSKSLGNFYTLRNLLDKGYSGEQIRYMLMQTHYKTQLNFTFEEVDAVKHSLDRLNDFIGRMYEIQDGDGKGLVEPILEKAMEAFAKALADDLNISVALASLFDLVREINTLCDQNNISQQEAEQVLKFLKQCDTVLGVLNFERLSDIPDEITEALENREQARKDKNWSLADELRDFITNSGYIIEDTPTGPRVKKG